MRKIRLTEQDLRNIITESVNRVISELDWRTYANASEKANRNEFFRIANNDKIGAAISRDQQHNLDSYINTARLKQYEFTEDEYKNAMAWYNSDGKRGEQPSRGTLKKLQRLMNDISNYNKGKSKYVKGQGWQNKE